ncbi:unnamed protein product [Symbiodinium pilosum]|uniref:Uncharacterized protein n=1 Tax=Symbiodinium pilosum TaxID=2952 RepID=A0A812XYG0_SYMPI|nr:unnamed protein product [Symbiodinium pilosum]
MEPFRFIGNLAPSKYKYVPTYIRVIHSLPHLVLLVGTGATLMLMVRIIMEYRNWYNVQHTNTDIVVFVLCFSYGLFCLQQFFKHLVEYSVDLQTRSVRLQASKHQVSQTFNETVTDLDAMLNKSADTQAALAERGLDSHRRDFHAFLLKGMARRLSGSAAGISTQSFISFMIPYLEIFKECSVDPIGEPYILATTEELQEKCSTPGQVAELVGNRAKGKEVKFLSHQVEEAKKKTSGLRQKWKKVTHVPKKVLKLTGISRFFKKRTKSSQKPADEEEGAFGSFSHDAVTEPRELKWFRFEPGCGIGMETTADEEDGPYPIQVKGFVFTCTVLSVEHVRLLLSFVAGLPLLILSFFAVSDPSRALILSIGVALICILFVLHDFLEIDAVQRMEIQIQEMQAAVAMVQQRREKMLEFFGKVHQLADLWLFRTLPRLELMKLLGESLQDAEDADVAKLMADITSKVSELEASLITLSDWNCDELPRESKKQVADAITKLTRLLAEQTLEQMPAASKELSQLRAAALATTA